MYINILVARIHYLDFYSYICTCNITRKKNQQFMIVFNYKNIMKVLPIQFPLCMFRNVYLFEQSIKFLNESVKICKRQVKKNDK